jgi:hypothetical protein
MRHPVEKAAAPILPFSIRYRKGTLLALKCHCPEKWDGKAAKRAGESEDLPEWMRILRGKWSALGF